MPAICLALCWAFMGPPEGPPPAPAEEPGPPVLPPLMLGGPPLALGGPPPWLVPWEDADEEDAGDVVEEGSWGRDAPGAAGEDSVDEGIVGRGKGGPPVDSRTLVLIGASAELEPS